MPLSRRTTAGSAMAFVAAILLLFALMRLPGHPDLFTREHVLHWPLELPLIVLVLALWPRRRGAWLRGALVLALTGLTLLRLADIGSRLAFGRAFSPLAELHLVAQGWTLASRTVGRGEAAIVVALALGVLFLLAVLLYRGLARIDAFGDTARRRLATGSAVFLAGGVALWAVQTRTGTDLGVRADLVTESIQRVDATRRAVADQRAFTDELASDPLALVPPPTFAALDGHDLIVLFVESYGRSFIDAELFAERAGIMLDALAMETARGGLAARSAWVESPIRGGRSWLAHATLASGLPLTNQARFDRLLGSERTSLHRLLGNAGWRTAVVLPVVSGEWVEGAWYDVDRFHDGPSLGYAGKGFGYVTMPDQFTLSAFERQIRRTDEAPLAATIGLLGSHAPWGPLALPVDWDTVGDGSVFDGSRRVGRPISWATPEPVREAYAHSLELTFARLGEYLVRYGDDALFIVIGDHQPASVIAGWAPNAHVPMHVFSRDPALLERLPADIFVDGTRPAADAPSLPMWSIRELFATAFEIPLVADGAVPAVPRP